jgi:hypothetical protein
VNGRIRAGFNANGRRRWRCKELKATVRCRVVSKALKTIPMPPANLGEDQVVAKEIARQGGHTAAACETDAFKDEDEPVYQSRGFVIRTRILGARAKKEVSRRNFI